MSDARTPTSTAPGTTASDADAPADTGVDPTADDLQIIDQDTGEYLIQQAAKQAASSPAPATPAAGEERDEKRVVVSAGDVEVDCPGCGLSVVGEAPRATAAWFCPRCDYPLFWVSEPPAATPPNRRARRRLPGTGGTEVLGAERCWHCGEMNEPGIAECLRCAATLPKPVPPAVPVVEVPVPVRTPVAVRFVTWPYVAAGTCAGGAIAMALTLWATGG